MSGETKVQVKPETTEQVDGSKEVSAIGSDVSSEAMQASITAGSTEKQVKMVIDDHGSIIPHSEFLANQESKK